MAIATQVQHGMGQHISDLSPSSAMSSQQVSTSLVLSIPNYVSNHSVGILGEHLAILSFTFLHQDLDSNPVPSHLPNATFPHHLHSYALYRRIVRYLGNIRHYIPLLPRSIFLGQDSRERQMSRSIRRLVLEFLHEYRAGLCYCSSSYAGAAEFGYPETTEEGAYDGFCFGRIVSLSFGSFNKAAVC